MSDSSQSHELQHARLPCPSLSPRVCSNSCPLSWWCYTTTSFSTTAFSFDLPSFPGSESFHWVDSSHKVVKVLKLQHQCYEYSRLIFFRIDWFYLLGVQRTLKSPLQHHRLIASILQHSAFFMVQLPCPYMTTGKTTTMTITDLCLQSNVSELFCHSFPSKEQASFNFMVTANGNSKSSTVIWSPRK